MFNLFYKKKNMTLKIHYRILFFILDFSNILLNSFCYFNKSIFTNIKIYGGINSPELSRYEKRILK